MGLRDRARQEVKRGRPVRLAAGLLFIGVQINHPPLDVTFVTTTDRAPPTLVDVREARAELVSC